MCERQRPSLGSSLSKRQNTRIVEFSAESLQQLGQVRLNYGLERPWQSPRHSFLPFDFVSIEIRERCYCVALQFYSILSIEA